MHSCTCYQSYIVAVFYDHVYLDLYDDLHVPRAKLAKHSCANSLIIQYAMLFNITMIILRIIWSC